MNIFRRKPGIIVIPASAVFIIFIILLVLFVGQKKSNNALILEHRALEIMNFLQVLSLTETDFEPSGIDPNIMGFGIYNKNNNAVRRYGTAPAVLPAEAGRGYNSVFAGYRSIIIIRRASEMPGMMRHMNPFEKKHRWETGNEHHFRIPQSFKKHQRGIYLEYRNSSYLSEQRLLMLIILLFTILFASALLFVFRLYNSNRALLVKAEHDRQLVQLGQAARTLAHEIKNPLSALKIQRDLLSKKLPDEHKRNLDVIDRELTRLNTLVNRVGEFLRNPKGMPEEMELCHFIRELYGERTHVTVLCPAGSALVYMDKERLHIILDNLVNNAIESGGSAEIRITDSKEKPGFTVADNGSGIAEEIRERLYDPFFTTRNNGSGLGLSIVKRLVEAAGGSISIKNRKSGGALVTVELGDNNESSYS